MELNINNLEEQDMKALVHSLELVSARVFESVVTTNQLASSTTPEMQGLFQQWLSIIARELINVIEDSGKVNPDEVAAMIGITPGSVLSLILTLQRQGKIKIKNLEIEVTNGKNTEICGCMEQ
ncbi:winged helix-turn-helix transcriptional regulator [Synergistaceae bacterium OttesenSCG-928-D05]|nr:winged helix-turn-helix transcriptional regulator [Synergistaceae bacterium OttesenSCG-928-D05]